MHIPVHILSVSRTCECSILAESSAIVSDILNLRVVFQAAVATALPTIVEDLHGTEFVWVGSGMSQIVVCIESSLTSRFFPQHMHSVKLLLFRLVAHSPRSVMSA